MKRRFRTEEDLIKAAHRRGFVVSGALKTENVVPLKEAPPERPEPPKVAAPEQAPAPQTDPALLQLLGSNADALQALTARLADQPDTTPDAPPRQWRVTVTARDYEGRIAEVRIEPQEARA